MKASLIEERPRCLARSLPQAGANDTQWQEHGERGGKSNRQQIQGRLNRLATLAQFLWLQWSHCYDPQSVVMRETYRAIVVILHSLPALVLSHPILET